MADNMGKSSTFASKIKEGLRREAKIYLVQEDRAALWKALGQDAQLSG